MSIFVQAWVYSYSEATLADRLVLLAIADEADDDGTNAYPSQDRIAHKTRLSRSTVKRCVASLEAAGELLVTRPESTGRGRFNRYTVVMGITLGETPPDNPQGAENEPLPVEKGVKRGSPVSQDPKTLRSKGERAQSEPLSGTSLGRTINAAPLWELDDDGNAVPATPRPDLEIVREATP